MRTPLNAIIGLSTLVLEDSELRQETWDDLEKIYNAGTTMLNMVNDILDISKIEAEKFELVLGEYDTPSMINDTIAQNIMGKGEKPIEFVLNIDENIPERLYGDDLRIRQVINNLLSNAFKYTMEGTVELNVKCQITDETAWLIVSVRDTGIGISSENIERLFIEYAQVDITLHHEIEGTGLGLAIAKRMTEMMGGSISVESEYGKGSIFTIKLPQKIVKAAPIGPDVVGNIRNFRYSTMKRENTLWLNRVKLPYARVLVVDDVANNLHVARGMMRPYEMKIDCVASGREAINAIRDQKVKYNAVFMDHMMPGIDGIEATRIIREEIGTEYAKTIPIIALTANAIVGNEEMFLNKGFQAYIPKPIEVIRLDAIINQWVRDKELEESLGNTFLKRSGQDRRTSSERRSMHDRQFTLDHVSGLDTKRGLERFSGDNETYRQVLQSFATNTRSYLETVEVVNEGNLADYAINVHGIKGSCRGICADVAGDLAEALEKAAKAGDLDFVTKNTPALIETISKLIADIQKALGKETSEKGKPKKDKPDTEVLVKLLIACEKYKIGEIEELMKEIDGFEYETDNELVHWLRTSVTKMDYAQIAEKLRIQ
jgi:CheY-like chemotaxis protein